jgi:LysM repeat protein
MRALVRDFSAVAMGDSMALDSSTINRKVDSTGLTAMAIHNATDSAKNQVVTPNTNTTNRNIPNNRVTPTVRNTTTSNNNHSPKMQRGEVTHTVKSGENLYRIAQRYHVTHEAIAKRNNLTNPRSLRPGQRLVIPAH